MKKRLFFVCLLLTACLTLMACAAPITFQTSGAQYEIVQMETADQALSLTPSAGNTLFVMTLSVGDDKLDDAQNAFFSTDGAKASVADGSGSYECKQIAFETNGSQTQAVLVFEVPAAFAQVKDFTLSGNGFGPVNLQK
ncbi:hypothetical protein [Christensenella timonensis]|uniref:hypothetical protein n=1 Tax=Christensenella timonensis TaxID=1816678 RepID=UPI00082B55D2|nr:hypothetical protein [Christensenella timonensis]